MALFYRDIRQIQLDFMFNLASNVKHIKLLYKIPSFVLQNVMLMF